MANVEVQRSADHPHAAASATTTWPPDGGEAWLSALRGGPGPAAHDRASDALYELLVGAARAEIRRRWADIGYVDDDAQDDLATQAADAALIALLSRLDDYRGESRFTTWACKFAIVEAGVRARRRAWRRRDVAIDAEGATRLVAPAGSTDADRAQRALLGALAEGSGVGLTGHQRGVLVALAIDRVPIDVLAERLNTTRGALYGTLHEARRRLREALADEGPTGGWV